MRILNFSYTLTETQEKQIQKLLNLNDDEWQEVDIRRIEARLNIDKDMQKQIERILASIPMSLKEWQAKPVMIVPPPIAHSAILIAVGIFSICGYFPPIIRRKKQQNTLPPQFVVAEIIELDAFKNKARSIIK